VNNSTTGVKLARHALRVVLCYLVVLQAFLASYGAASALSPASAADYIICHSTSDDTGKSPDPAAPPRVFCTLCVMAASAGGLPVDPAVTVTSPRIVVDQVRPSQGADVVGPPLARAGLSRAPPRLS
jgi:hypothetical protein